MTMLRFSPLFAAMSVACGSTPADAQTTSPDKPAGGETPALTVRGSAEIDKPADELRLTIGVVTEGEDATEALDRNSKQMHDVIEAVERVGLEKQEYETGRFSLQPVYSRRPRQAEADWRPTIVGYQVSNTIGVKTKKLDLAGPIIEKANKAGANSIDQIRFDLSDDRIHRAEAIRTATQHALADARVLAEAADLELVRVLSINLDDTPRPMPREFATAARMSADAAPPPIAPGQITVRASVTVVYEIASRN